MQGRIEIRPYAETAGLVGALHAVPLIGNKGRLPHS
jgi:hypothetical protein